jgi:hypothetical protein
MDFETDWQEALSSGRSTEIAAVLQRSGEIPVGEWARLLKSAFDQGHADLVMAAVAPERLIDALVEGDFQLAKAWVDVLVRRGATGDLADFASRLLRRSTEIDQLAADGLHASLAHAIAFLSPDLAELLMERRVGSVPDHWMVGLIRNRLMVGRILQRLPRDLAVLWVKHLDESDGSATYAPGELEILIRRTRECLGRRSRAFSKLSQFGPAILRMACLMEHQNRSPGDHSSSRGDRSRDPLEPAKGLLLWQLLISLLAIMGILYMLHLAARNELQKIKGIYKASSLVTAPLAGPLQSLELRPPRLAWTRED